MNSQTTERFNALGPTQRDCPICFRAGSLTGARADGAPMQCGGCFARFTFTRGDGVTPDTLTRLPSSTSVVDAQRSDFDARR